MAEKTAFDALSFGIQHTETMGSIQELDDFLNDEDTTKVIPKKEGAVEKIIPGQKPIPEKPKEGEKPETPPEPSADDLLNEVLGKEEEGEKKEEEKIEGDGKEKPTEIPGETEEEGEDVNKWSVYSKELFKEGIFSADEGEEVEVPTTAQELKEQFEKQGQKGASRWLNSFLSAEGEDRVELFQAIFVDKVDPKEYFSTYNEISDLKEMDLEQEDNQRTVYKEYLRRQGFDANKIAAKLEKSIERGDLLEDSKDAHEWILARDAESLEEQRVEGQRQAVNKQRIEAEYRSNLSKILSDKVKTKEINGIPLNEEVAKKAFDFLNTKKWKTADGTELTDFDNFILETRKPENHEKRLMIALLAMSNFDMSKIKQKAISEQSSELFTELARKNKGKVVPTKTTLIKANPSPAWNRL